jgi:hypothetical protein
MTEFNGLVKQTILLFIIMFIYVMKDEPQARPGRLRQTHFAAPLTVVVERRRNVGSGKKTVKIAKNYPINVL